MYSTLVTFVALFVTPALAGFAINSPVLTQCGTSQVSWASSNGPYNVIAVAADDPCGDALAEIGDFTGTSVQWKVTIPAGTIIQLSVADADENEAWSKNITIGASSDSSCVSAASPGGSSSSTSTTNTTSSDSSGSSDGSYGSNGTPTDGADGPDGTDVAPIGAANAGTNGLLNAAPSVRQISTPAMALCALAAVIALAL